MTYHLAIDIGASGGRHILGCFDGTSVEMKEIYRFSNGMERVNGSLTWDVQKLFSEVLQGLLQCRKTGITPDTVAIDTWGVDYVLLDADRKEILPVFAYRDSRNNAAVKELHRVISEKSLYMRTGIQKQSINTIYQLWCDKKTGRLDRAETFLMLPDYLIWRLTGRECAEYTEASTSGLLRPDGIWDEALLDLLGYPKGLFQPLMQPGTVVGSLSPQIREQVGFDTHVVLAPSHDTAAAIAAAPLEPNTMYISSGTWSLAGLELDAPIITEAAQRANLTNEGGVKGTICFLKNIMGMWLFQNLRREFNDRYSFEEVAAMARSVSDPILIDVNDPSLTAPESMLTALRKLMGKPDAAPEQIYASLYHSLAHCYAATADQLESVSGKTIRSICIVGGGSLDRYLNRLTEQYSRRKVITGLREATAAGNILSQLWALHPDMDLAQSRMLFHNTAAFQEGSI